MVVQGFGGPKPLLKVVPGSPGPLLTVRQVAAQLGVSTATVYALVERGELPHIRVSNAIRVAPAAVAAFVTAWTSTARRDG